MTFLLCDPGWCVHNSDVQNKWDDNTHTHTHILYYAYYCCCIAINTAPVHSSEVPRNPLTRWDVSSIPANGIFLTKKQKNKKQNAQRVEND